MQMRVFNVRLYNVSAIILCMHACINIMLEHHDKLTESEK